MLTYREPIHYSALRNWRTKSVREPIPTGLPRETITRMLPRTATRSKPSAIFSALPAPITVTTVVHTITVSIPSTRRTRRNFRASACWLTSITTSMRSCTSPRSIGRKTARKDAGAVSPSLANVPSRALCRTKSSCSPSWISCARPTAGISRNSCMTVWKTSSARAETIASIARARNISRTRATRIIGNTLSTGHFSRKRHEAGNQTERENRPLQRGRS